LAHVGGLDKGINYLPKARPDYPAQMGASD
jgi:hypothetical protein